MTTLAPEPNPDGAGGELPESNHLRPRLHGDLLASSLLAFLRRWNAYGYQLVRELANAGLPFDSATVYRTLRQLERAGLVSSFWDTSDSGPARRRYSLTQAGGTFLNLWLDVLNHYQNILQAALNSYKNLDKGIEGHRSPQPEPQRSRKRGTHA